jgi:hypothetical protein
VLLLLLLPQGFLVLHCTGTLPAGGSGVLPENGLKEIPVRDRRHAGKQLLGNTLALSPERLRGFHRGTVLVPGVVADLARKGMLRIEKGLLLLLLLVLLLTLVVLGGGISSGKHFSLCCLTVLLQLLLM